MIENYPLYWPEGWDRTSPDRRRHSSFHVTFVQARDGLMDELKRLGATHITITTNIPCRRDGLPYANTGEPEDAGIAVWFIYNVQQCCLACDKWKKTRDNLQAIRKTIEALRGIDRWGASTVIERAFVGFTPGVPLLTTTTVHEGVLVE